MIRALVPAKARTRHQVQQSAPGGLTRSGDCQVAHGDQSEDVRFVRRVQAQSTEWRLVSFCKESCLPSWHVSWRYMTVANRQTIGPPELVPFPGTGRGMVVVVRAAPNAPCARSLEGGVSQKAGGYRASNPDK